MDNDRIFGENSFTDEIQTKEDAAQSVHYLASNEHTFTKELTNEGLSYDEVQSALATVWKNLALSCQRVGYSDRLLVSKVNQFGINNK